MKPLVYNETLGWNPYGFEKSPNEAHNEAHDDLIKKSEMDKTNGTPVIPLGLNWVGLPMVNG